MTVPSRGPMPPDIRARWEASLRQVNPAEMDEIFAQSTAAAEEQSFSGFVRRCVHRQAQPLSRVAAAASIELERLAKFLRGSGTLDSSEIDRLLKSLGVELVGSSPHF